jgi:hypothetical protein
MRISPSVFGGSSKLTIKTKLSLEREDAFGKWCHRLASVRWDDSFKSRDSALNFTLRKESEDTKHGKPSVVDFLDKSVGLVFL